jgi:hypothetical protein
MGAELSCTFGVAGDREAGIELLTSPKRKQVRDPKEVLLYLRQRHNSQIDVRKRPNCTSNSDLHEAYYDEALSGGVRSEHGCIAPLAASLYHLDEITRELRATPLSIPIRPGIRGGTGAIN